MARTRERPRRSWPRTLARLGRVGLASACVPALAVGSWALQGASSPADAATIPRLGEGPTSATWCSSHGSSLVGWTATVPDLPICGVGPAYGGTWDYVNLPGPGGITSGYYSATPGFQCVELADRFLAVVYGLAPVHANGESVAANYHAAYPESTLYVNGTSSSVGHPPEPGDVLSLAEDPSFQGYDDGHVAVVVKSAVDGATGDGRIVVAQENVASTDYWKTIDVVGWRLEDPDAPSNPEYQFAYAEWLHIGPMPAVQAAAAAQRRVAAKRRVYFDAVRVDWVGLTARLALDAHAGTSGSPFVRSAPPLVTAGLGLPLAGSTVRLATPGSERVALVRSRPGRRRDASRGPAASSSRFAATLVLWKTQTGTR
ncbi:MAG: hypothetical protein JWO62_1691 [Acidimicrobiaceae bacterium]|nr:hypothetical protein [Acidimicrobiaceae bacterium]